MHHRAVLAAFLAGAAAAVTLRSGEQQTTMVVAAGAAAARPAETPDPDAVRRATESVNAGLEHARADRPEAASTAFANAAEALPAFESWAAMLSAQAWARVGDTAAVRRELARSDTSLVREWGWRARVDAALASGDTTRAARLAEQSAMRVRDAARRAEAWTRAGTLHAHKGQKTTARTALRRAIDASAGADAALEAARTLARIGPTAADQRRIGRVHLRHGDYDRAASAISAYVRSGGVTVAERTNLQLELGRALFNARDYDAAVRRLRLAISIAGKNASA